MAIIADEHNLIVVQGITGREASMVAKHMLDYGTRIEAGVTPGKSGQSVHGIPVYDSVKSALKEHALNTSIVYVPPASVKDASFEAIDQGLKLILIITERVPIRDVAEVVSHAEKNKARVIGPNITGAISPAKRVKLGPIGGDNPSRAFVPGPFGIISRSGGMTSEVAWMVRRAGYGTSTSVSIGGDPIIGTSFKDLLELYERDSETKGVVMFCEPGGALEEEAAEFIREGGFTKPTIAYVAGLFVDEMPSGARFGHAGAIVERGTGSPSRKKEVLEGAGVLVAKSFSDIVPLVQGIRGRDIGT